MFKVIWQRHCLSKSLRDLRHEHKRLEAELDQLHLDITATEQSLEMIRANKVCIKKQDSIKVEHRVEEYYERVETRTIKRLNHYLTDVTKIEESLRLLSEQEATLLTELHALSRRQS